MVFLIKYERCAIVTHCYGFDPWKFHIRLCFQCHLRYLPRTTWFSLGQSRRYCSCLHLWQSALFFRQKYTFSLWPSCRPTWYSSFYCPDRSSDLIQGAWRIVFDCKLGRCKDCLFQSQFSAVLPSWFPEFPQWSLTGIFATHICPQGTAFSRIDAFLSTVAFLQAGPPALSTIRLYY
ncbi:hypothetical protein BDR07DRAFT_154189 [Suillus spraguei]|nr:hypothetical protein BDR07DRAFT_154189 [Suillus spraguei]